eukprot:scpid82544/ scgid1924/ 
MVLIKSTHPVFLAVLLCRFQLSNPLTYVCVYVPIVFRTALRSPASFSITPGHGTESIFTFPPPGSGPPPSGLSLAPGQPLTPILVMDPSSSAFAGGPNVSQAVDMSGGGSSASQPAFPPPGTGMSPYSHPAKKPPPSMPGIAMPMNKPHHAGGSGHHW